MQLHAFFERAAILARREGLPFTARDKALTVPVENIRRYLGLDGNNLVMKPHFATRIEYNLRVNVNSRPGKTGGFESNPEQKLVRRVKPEFRDPARAEDSDDEYFHASQSIIVTDYKKAIGRHGFAVMIQGRMTSYFKDLPVIFGFHGSYGKDGLLSVRRIAVPMYENGEMTGLQDIAVTKENIVQALTYARLCADQVYSKEHLTPYSNWQRAAEIASRPDPAASSPHPD